MEKKPHYAGEDHVPPLPGSKGYIRVVKRGCGSRQDYWGEYDCRHHYTWECEACPVHLEYIKEKYMQAEIINEPIVKLTMTAQQAQWLKNVMQNPLSEDPDPANEYLVDRRNRSALFEALRACLGD